MIPPAIEAAAPAARTHHHPPPSPARSGSATTVATAIRTRHAITNPVPKSPRTTMITATAAAISAIRRATSDVKRDFAGRAVRRRDLERQRAVLDRRTRDPEQDHAALDRSAG